LFRGLSFPSLLPRAGDQPSLGEQHRVALNLVAPVVKVLALFCLEDEGHLHQENSCCKNERDCDHPEVTFQRS
jgi:hypothetical protein